MVELGLSECDYVSLDEFNVLYCKDGRIILSSIDSPSLTTAIMPYSIWNTVDENVKIFQTNEDVLVMAGTYVYRMTIEQDRIKLTYLFNMASLISNISDR